MHLRITPSISRSGSRWHMAFGADVVLFSLAADADPQFLPEMLGTRAVDAGDGGLILARRRRRSRSPARGPGTELHPMCEDLAAEVESLRTREARCAAVDDAHWRSITKIARPGGGRSGSTSPCTRSRLSTATDPSPLASQAHVGSRSVPGSDVEPSTPEGRERFASGRGRRGRGRCCESHVFRRTASTPYNGMRGARTRILLAGDCCFGPDECDRTGAWSGHREGCPW